MPRPQYTISELNTFSGKYKKTTNGEKTKKNMIVPFQNIQTLGKMLKKIFFKLEINFSILKGILKINNLNF